MSTPASTPTSRRGQIMQTYPMAKRSDPRLGLIMLGVFVRRRRGRLRPDVAAARARRLSLVISIVGALMIGILLALLVFGRRAQKAAYTQMEGQPAAAAARSRCCAAAGRSTRSSASPSSRTSCTASSARPASSWSARARARPGVKQLMATERKKHERVAYGVADPRGRRRPRRGRGAAAQAGAPRPEARPHVKPAEMTDILQRLKALDAQRGKLPLPKGPIPTSMKGMRSQQRGR